MSFTSEEVAALMAPPGTSAEQVLTPRTHDEQFTLLDANHKALAHTYYTIGKSDGSLVHGVTDSKGVTARHKTIGAQTIAIYLGHREP
ncbi:hypothetical protein D0B32_08725 [Paraburkholderia sp. DHOC27]|nr:hypothetical protein D0B32_08725 [Paraburkholderia sp. DHOC27]